MKKFTDYIKESLLDNENNIIDNSNYKRFCDLKMGDIVYICFDKKSQFEKWTVMRDECNADITVDNKYFYLHLEIAVLLPKSIFNGYEYYDKKSHNYITTVKALAEKHIKKTDESLLEPEDNIVNSNIILYKLVKDIHKYQDDRREKAFDELSDIIKKHLVLPDKGVIIAINSANICIDWRNIEHNIRERGKYYILTSQYWAIRGISYKIDWKHYEGYGNLRKAVFTKNPEIDDWYTEFGENFIYYIDKEFAKELYNIIDTIYKHGKSE